MSSSGTQTASPAKHMSSDAVVSTPRKRRRRAPAAGPSEDCFACLKRGKQCDRRRPYCSQCLDLGKACSGYRTTLTWGVGVASRGKLRGQSLPVASQRSTIQRDVAAATKTPKTPHTGSRGQSGRTIGADSARVPQGTPSPNVCAAPQDYLQFGLDSPPCPTARMECLATASEKLGFRHSQSAKFTRFHPHRRPLQTLHTALPVAHGAVDFSLPATPPSVGAYSDEFNSPIALPLSPMEFHFGPSHPPVFVDDSYPLCPTETSHFWEVSYPSFPIPDAMSSSISSDQSARDFPEAGTVPEAFAGEMHFSTGAYLEPGFEYLPARGTYLRKAWKGKSLIPCQMEFPASRIFPVFPQLRASYAQSTYPPATASAALVAVPILCALSSEKARQVTQFWNMRTR